MVQLRSAMVDLARIRLDPDSTNAAWQRSESVREALDGSMRDRLVEWAGGAGQRILVIGAGWPRLIGDLAESGAWVGVVEPDADRRRAVSQAIGAGRDLARVTVHDNDYKDRSFDVSAFNVIVAWDVLHRYTEVLPLLKKMVRELKAGGKVFIRSPICSRVRGRDLRRLVRSLIALLPHADRDIVGEDTFLMPDAAALNADSLIEAVESLFVVHDTAREHALAVDVADLVASGNASAFLLSAARAFDAQLVARQPAAARTLALFAAKEKQLGRVFKP